MDIPVYAQGFLTVEDLLQDSFEGKIGQFTREQQQELKGLRRKLKNRVSGTFQFLVGRFKINCCHRSLLRPAVKERKQRWKVSKQKRKV